MKLLAILAREGAISIQLNDLVTMSALLFSVSISYQVNEDLLIQSSNGFVYISPRVYP